MYLYITGAPNIKAGFFLTGNIENPSTILLYDNLNLYANVKDELKANRPAQDKEVQYEPAKNEPIKKKPAENETVQDESVPNNKSQPNESPSSGIEPEVKGSPSDNLMTPEASSPGPKGKSGDENEPCKTESHSAPQLKGSHSQSEAKNQNDHITDLKDNHTKIADELKNVKNNLDQANKDQDHYIDVLKEIDKAVTLDEKLPDKAKDKNRHFMELNKEFSEIFTPENTRRQNLEEVGKFAKEEIDSAKNWKVELETQKSELAKELSIVDTELGKLKKDFDGENSTLAPKSDTSPLAHRPEGPKEVGDEKKAEKDLREETYTPVDSIKPEEHSETSEIREEGDSPAEIVSTEKSLSSGKKLNSEMDTSVGTKEGEKLKEDSVSGTPLDVTPESRTDKEGSSTVCCSLLTVMGTIGDAIATAIQNLI